MIFRIYYLHVSFSSYPKNQSDKNIRVFLFGQKYICPASWLYFKNQNFFQGIMVCVKPFSYSHISKEDSAYLKGWAILIMIFLHVFGSRAVNMPAYRQLDDICYWNGVPLSYCISRFCSICVHLYILLSGYGFYIIYRQKKRKRERMHTVRRILCS